MKKILSLSVSLSFIAGLFGGLIGSKLFENTDQGKTQSIREEKSYVEESSFTQAIDKVRPSVVSIVLSKNIQINQQPIGMDPFFQQFFGFGPNSPFQQQQRPQGGDQSQSKKQIVGGGSGFITSKDGLVLTNRHVVDDPDAQYTVILSDGREFPAKVLSKDPLNDLGALKILPKEGSSKLPDLTPVEFGDSTSLKVGQRVLAIGNALGEYQNTVTAGIISASDREIVAGDGRGMSETLTGLLQTDAAINPGNSGGPLINLNGQVIGVNVAVAQSANGIGFAIPIDDVKPVLESLQKNGKIIRPILGVRYTIITDDRAKELELKGSKGGALLVGGNEQNGEFAIIPAGPGAKAGLKKGDVIMEVEGKKITPEYGLQQAIRNRKPGDKVKIKVWSDGKIFEKTIELGQSE